MICSLGLVGRLGDTEVLKYWKAEASWYLLRNE